MTSTLRLAVLVLGLVLSLTSSSQAQEKRYVTTTLLPVQIKATAGPDGLLWIRQGADNDVKPDKDVFLQFDLSSLPPGLAEADIQSATLRLVAQTVVYQPPGDTDTGGTLVSVKGQVAKPDLSGTEATATVVALSTLTATNPVARQAPEDLRKAVYRHYAAADKRFSLRLFSESHKASTLLYSMTGPKGFGGTQSNIPRLVIQYTLGSPPLLESLGWSQRQRGPEHTGRNAWTPLAPPTGVTLSRIEMPKIDGKAGSVADYPLIHRGAIYLVYKVEEVNRLLALDFKGNELWKTEIRKGTVERSPVISRDGRFYVVIGDEINSYDLNASGKLLHSYQLTGKVSDYSDLTVGNDGSLFVALKESDANAIYGFTADLKPFLKSEPFGTGPAKISTPTVSADGQRIFAQIPAGAAIIDIANPGRAQIVKLTSGTDAPWEYYHAPIAGPAGGITVYADFTSTANKGHVWGRTAEQGVWSDAGSLIPQPVLGSNGIVYYVQESAFRGHPYNQVGSATIDKKDGLKATSNLVMDGANNTYFWDNGKLRGYDANGVKLFESDFTGLDKVRPADPEEVDDKTKATSDKTKATRVTSGPEQFIRLMLGPDGTLWANNRSGDSLYAFRPTFAAADPTLTQELQDQTIYRATGTLTVGTPPVTAGTRVLLQGATGIVLPRGFAVDKGASVLCRTGF